MPLLLLLWPLLISCAPDPVERCLRYPDGDGDELVAAWRWLRRRPA